MICSKQATPIDGLTIYGETFVPADDNTAHAVFHRDGRCCGITYAIGRYHAFLRCNPGLMLPPGARDINVWHRLAWSLDDDRLVDFTIDESDGELYFNYDEPVVGEEPERCVGEAVELLLSDEFEQFVLGFVRECYGS